VNKKITIQNGKLNVPDNPVIPFIEGDGNGIDIWPASKLVFDNAVDKAYNGTKQINWKEVFAGQKAYDRSNTWLPDET
jgi:isocitrate dehydrogenase